MDRRAIDVLSFWWDAGPERWFSSCEAFDAEIRSRFLPLHANAAAGALDDWADTPSGALALIVLLDQFPRNMFRGSARAFATDAKALNLAEAAIARRFHLAFPRLVRKFFLLPFEHAEDLAAQERCLDLCRACADKETYYWALVHMDVIRRFGRFPHRNAILRRQTTPEEQAYLDAEDLES